jgi:hypothetical protein
VSGDDPLKGRGVQFEVMVFVPGQQLLGGKCDAGGWGRNPHRLQKRAVSRIEDPQAPICAGSGQLRKRRMVCQGKDGGTCLNLSLELVVVQPPEINLPIRSGDGNLLAIGTHRQCRGSSVASAQRGERLAGRIPHFHSLVAAGADPSLAVIADDRPGGGSRVGDGRRSRQSPWCRPC